eukprot:6228201-Amphidinium_carterae.1
MAARCSSSTMYVYADDLIIVASTPKLLQGAMAYLASLLTSLDFEVNPSKSSISVMGSSVVPSISLSGSALHLEANPELFGSTVISGSVGLASPGALPDRSSSRTVARWTKI